MHLASVEFGELLKSASAVFIVSAQHRKRHKHLVGMQAWIAAAQIVDFSVLNRLDHMLRNQFHIVVNACKMLYRIENQCCTRAKQFACLSRYYRAVGKLDGRTGMAAPLGTLFGRHRGAPI